MLKKFDGFTLFTYGFKYIVIYKPTGSKYADHRAGKEISNLHIMRTLRISIFE